MPPPPTTMTLVDVLDAAIFAGDWPRAGVGRGNTFGQRGSRFQKNEEILEEIYGYR